MQRNHIMPLPSLQVFYEIKQKQPLYSFCSFAPIHKKTQLLTYIHIKQIHTTHKTMRFKQMYLFI